MMLMTELAKKPTTIPITQHKIRRRAPRLRGVSLIGIDSVMCPLPLRQEAWRRLETDLDRGKIESMTSEIGLSDVIDAGPRILAGEVRGRIVVKVR